MTDYLEFVKNMPAANTQPDQDPTAGAEPIEGAVLAMAYVPMQKLTTVYEPDSALNAGTLFPDLNKPFLGRKGCGR